MSPEEVFKVYAAEGPIGLQRLKEEGEIYDYEQAEDGVYSVVAVGHIEKFEVDMSVGVNQEAKRE